MKKEYVKPTIVVEEILLESMMATSNPNGGNQGVEDEETDDGFSNSHRGSWGDLWN